MIDIEEASFIFTLTAMLMANSLALGFCIGAVYGKYEIIRKLKGLQ